MKGVQFLCDKLLPMSSVMAWTGRLRFEQSCIQHATLQFKAESYAVSDKSGLDEVTKSLAHHLDNLHQTRLRIPVTSASHDHVP